MTTPPGDQPPYDPNQPPYEQQPGEQPYGQQGYGQQYAPPPQGGYAQPQASNALGVTSLVLGILGIPGALCCFGGVLAPIAAVLGWMGMKKADASNGRVGGRGISLAGLILGVIGTVIFVGILVWFVVALATGEDFNYQYNTG